MDWIDGPPERVEGNLPIGVLLYFDPEWVKENYQPDFPNPQLVGDINKLCGVCNDCMMFRADELAHVTRHKVVWTRE